MATMGSMAARGGKGLGWGVMLLLSLGEGQALQAAVSAPNLMVLEPRRLLLEQPSPHAGALADRGHRVQSLALPSGLHALRRRSRIELVILPREEPSTRAPRRAYDEE